MDNTQKMLRTIINGQSAMKSELLVKIEGVHKEVISVKEDLKKVESNLTKRIDKIGLQAANLEDDAPTVKEFDRLEKRVTKVEQKVAAI